MKLSDNGVIIISGSTDLITLRSEAIELFDLIKENQNVKHIVVEEAGHQLMIEQSKEVFQHLMELWGK